MLNDTFHCFKELSCGKDIAAARMREVTLRKRCRNLPVEREFEQ
jgi:hypothetical protein